MNLTVNRLLDLYSKRFNELKNVDVKEPIIEGFYQIASVDKFETISDGINLHVSADWKPLGTGKAQPSIKLSVKLGNLYSVDSIGPKEVNPEGLNKAIIEVSSTKVKQERSTGHYRTYCHWKILGFKKQIKEIDRESYEEFDEDTVLTKMTDEQQIKDVLNSKPSFK